MSSIIKVNDQNFIIDKNADQTLPYTIRKKASLAIEINEDNFPKLSHEQQIAYCESMLKKAKEQAKKIVEQSQSFAIDHMKEITDKAKADYDDQMNVAREEGIRQGIEIGKKKGLTIGYDEGMHQGKIEAEKISNKTVEFMHGVIEGIDEGKQAMLKKYHADLKDVAFTIAQKILHKELQEHPEDMEKMIESAASMCKNQGYLRVIVSEKSYQLFLGDSALAQRLSSYADDIKFVMDSSMKDTDCVIETPNGVINAGVDTQLENIKTAIDNIDEDE